MKTAKAKTEKRKFGWKPDLTDHRDHIYAASAVVRAKLPTAVDLRKQCPPVYNQGELGSCTANAIGAAIEFEKLKKTKKAFTPSRLFIYYKRVMEDTVAQDNGAQIRNGIKTVRKAGVCLESLWPYDDDGAQLFTKKPTANCYKEALTNQVVSYQRLVQNLTQMKTCLASGYPFVFGFTVFENIYSDAVTKTGKLNLPGPKDAMVGGHAVMAVGYDDKEQRFIIRNSWGNKWAQKGYFTMPYAYVTDSNYSDDFWTIRMVE